MIQHAISNSRKDENDKNQALDLKIKKATTASETDMETMNKIPNSK